MPKGEVTLTLLAEPGWFRRPPEFVGGLWVTRGLLSSDDISYNLTTNKYISIGAPLFAATSTPAGVTVRIPKPIIIHTVGIMFNSAFPGGASASWRFNLDGTTRSEIEVAATTGDSKKVGTGELEVPLDGMLCLETVTDVGGTPDIRSISIAYRTRPGVDPTV